MIFHICLAFLFISQTCGGPFDWVGRDAFDVIMKKYSGVDDNNCGSMTSAELTLPAETVSMLPQSNQLLDVNTRVFRNRTCVLALHDLALSRGFFFSYAFKFLNATNGTQGFWKQPGLQYYYWRQASFISAFPKCINGSSTEFDYKAAYPNWLNSIAFNSTMELFAPRATRNVNFMPNRFWVYGPSMNRIHINDMGAGKHRNYTDKESGARHIRYRSWLPDFTADDNLKGSYTVGVKYAHWDKPGKWQDETFKGVNFFGPPLTRLQDNVNLPVRYSLPYFDCGGRNVWMMSAAAPIVDAIPRYRPENIIKEFGETPQRFVAVATMDIDWDMIDINVCPESIGNPGPNIFAGVARCKPTTQCQPLSGFGFARGGYECVCRPGYRYPHWQNGPFQGVDIEIATEEEYRDGFDCLKIDNLRVVPSVNSGDLTQTNLTSRRKREVTNYEDSSSSDETQNREIQKAQHIDVQADLNTVMRKAINDEIDAAVASKVLIPRQNKVVDFKDITKSGKEGKKVSIKPRTKVSFKKKHTNDETMRWIYGHKKRTDDKHSSVNTAKARSRMKRDYVDDSAIDRMKQIFEHIEKVKTSDCTKMSKYDLSLPGDVSFGAKDQFQNQARTALSLAHFISSFLQHVERMESHGVVKGDKYLNPDILHAEVLSLVMADHKIRGLGVWYDENQYEEPYGTEGEHVRRRKYFAPFAFQKDGLYSTVDLAGDPKLGRYVHSDWFRRAKDRWRSNTNGLKTYAPAGKIRVDRDGLYPTVKILPYPSKYKAAPYDVGMWSSPYFPCTEYGSEWIITYYAPFFGKDDFDRQRLRFKGLVSVDIKFEFLDINQCPGEVFEVNAFKDTARCHYQSTYCVPVEGKRFERGAYRCECKQGYEYPFQENAWFFDGALLEAEYEKKMKGALNKFEHLKCRPADASTISFSLTLTVLSTCLAFLL